MNMMTKNIIFAVMAAEEFLLKNQKNIKTNPRWETFHTFYKILNY